MCNKCTFPLTLINAIHGRNKIWVAQVEHCKLPRLFPLLQLVVGCVRMEERWIPEPALVPVLVASLGLTAKVSTLCVVCRSLIFCFTFLL